MRKLHLFLILLLTTIPCFAQTGVTGPNSAQPASDSNELDCLSETAPEYERWVEFDKPDCWCYQKQCRGDINGSMFLGKPVTLAELGPFKAAFNQPKEYFLLNPLSICADLDHNGFLNKFVTLGDLEIFKRYFNKVDSLVPRCDEEPIYTGPYNFWTN